MHPPPDPLLLARCIAGRLRSAPASRPAFEGRGEAPQGTLRPPRSLPGPSALRPPKCAARLQPPPPAGGRPGRTSGSGAPVAQAVCHAPLRPARRAATCPDSFPRARYLQSPKTQPVSSPLRFSKTHMSPWGRPREPRSRRFVSGRRTRQLATFATIPVVFSRYAPFLPLPPLSSPASSATLPSNRCTRADSPWPRSSSRTPF